MSLSSLLLASAKPKGSKKTRIDSELDSLFQSSAQKVQNSQDTLPIAGPSGSSSRAGDGPGKRKLIEKSGEIPVSKKKSRTAGSLQLSAHDAPKDNSPAVPPTQGTSTVTKGKDLTKSSKKSGDSYRKGASTKHKADISSEEDNPDVEESYQAKRDASKVAPTTGSNESDDSEDEGLSELVHESLRKTEVKTAHQTGGGRKMKWAPPGETVEQRNARTIFIGNLSLEVAQKTSLLKQLKRHILSFVPGAKIESSRFRSVPFQSPTSKLALDDDAAQPKKNGNAKVDAVDPAKSARTHDLERTTAWRRRDDAEKDNEALRVDEKKYLSPAEKKKIAFINRDFHGEADTVHAYVVFAHPIPARGGAEDNAPDAESASTSASSPMMDPYEAARTAALQCNSSMFLGRMLRVDVAGRGAHRPSLGGTAPDGDAKKTVFIGNLDFASKEEDLRVFFERLVADERGPPAGGGDGEEADVPAKPKTWVTRVRIIRDKDTQLGKGFAYVQFADRECVDEILAMEETKLKFAKRKLRAQRCKTLPGQPALSKPLKSVKPTDPSPARGGTKPSTARSHLARDPPAAIPAGDPTLGARLAHLPKDARKEIKAADAERVARRMAKKKARSALAKEGVKVQIKDRERVRKSAGAKSFKAGKKERKGRVRSDKSVAKKNVKK